MSRTASLLIKAVSLRLLPVLCLLCCLTLQAPASEVLKAYRPAADVLILASFHAGHFWERQLIQRLDAELDHKDSEFNIRLHCEYLDYERHLPGSLDSEHIRLFSRKYSGVALKCIIAVDNDALKFLLNHGDSLFPDVPVVYCGIADPPAALEERRDLYTGILENFSIHRILEAIPLVHPACRHLVVLCGDTTSARTALHQAEAELSAIPPDISLTRLVALGRRAMKEALSDLPPDSVLLNFGYYRSGDGQNFSMKESLQLLQNWTPLPMYSPWGGQLGEGVLAGQYDFNSFHAVEAARMTQAVLRGTPPAKLPPLCEPAPCLVYDYAMLRHYGLSEYRLPSAAKLVNKPQSFYTKHKTVLLPAMSVVMVLVMIILLLVHLLRLKQHSEALLQQEKLLRERAHSLERRSRIARHMEALGRLAGGITHDVNNILGGIAACAQLALPEIPPDNPAHEDVSRILDATSRGKELMKKIRMTDSTKALNSNVETAPVAALLKDCDDRLRPLIPDVISLQVQDDSRGACIQVVPSELHQILLNLALNAVQAMPDGGILSITASIYDFPDNIPREADSIAPGSIRMDVTDTGSGIPADLMEIIFDPFFTTRKDKGGCGLGLAQVHSLVQRNGGLVLAGKAAGGGALFSLFFPPAAGRDTAAPADISPTFTDAGGDTARTSTGLHSWHES